MGISCDDRFGLCCDPDAAAGVDSMFSGVYIVRGLTFSASGQLSVCDDACPPLDEALLLAGEAAPSQLSRCSIGDEM